MAKKPGRPFGSKDSKPRTRTNVSKDKEITKTDDKKIDSVTKSISHHLTGSIKKLFDTYSKEYKTPLDALKAVAKTMHARHHAALISEMKDYEVKVKQAQDEYDQIIKTKRINGRAVKELTIEKKLKRLEVVINSKYYLSSQLTTLESELLKMYSEIERIESGRDDRDVNIFNILHGKVDPELTKRFQEGFFAHNDDILDTEDADWVEKEKKENQEQEGKE